MASVQTKRINGYGPYSWLVTYRDGKHHWAWIAADEVDPRDYVSDDGSLTKRGQRLVGDGDAVSIDVYDRDIANDLRDEIEDRWGEHALSDDDDRRTTTIELSPAAPETARRLTASNANEMEKEEKSKAGQVPLTDHERAQFDFTEDGVNVPFLRSVKGVLLDEGVSDWMSYVDTTLSTADEHRSTIGADAKSGGRRLDNDEDVSAFSYQREMSELEKHALKYAEEGDENAIDTLKDDFGWNDNEISARMDAGAQASGAVA